MGQTALVLAIGTLLQCHQPITTTAVGNVVPKVAGLHAVLPYVAPWRPEMLLNSINNISFIDEMTKETRRTVNASPFW